MRSTIPVLSVLLLTGMLLFGYVPFVLAQEAEEEKPVIPPISEEVIVSATKMPEDSEDVPSSTSVITGDELKRSGAKTVAEAIQDVVGVDTGNGSDDGPWLPNIGMWGLKEFDALLITVDGVPVGGPFNPSLSQVNIDDVDRIEIVKGPEGTLYGVSAFAGMIQVFTNKTDAHHGMVSAGGGSFSTGYGSVSYTAPFSDATKLRIYGHFGTSDGWQDRTGLDDDRLTLNLEHNFEKATLQVSFFGFRYDQNWGSPIPVDAGEIVPGFVIDGNYAVEGAQVEHHLFGINSYYNRQLNSNLGFTNTLGFAHDNQDFLRSFIQAVFEEDGFVAAESEGVLLDPTETTFFDEGRFTTSFNAGGSHHLVTGAAITWGKTKASGHGFDFDLEVSPVVEVPGLDEIPFGDNRAFDDERTFFGIYLRDEWYPHPRVEIAGGIRMDHTSENLEAEFEELGEGGGEGIEGATTDSRSDTKLSGDGAVLFHLISNSSNLANQVNLYFAAKSTFKPAAPNLSEAEAAQILKPERAKSIEGGVKTRAFDDQLWVDLSLFHMDFENLVVSIFGENGEPQLTNAGKERFTGVEVDMEWHPVKLANTFVKVGYAHHNPKFVDFSFFTPDGEFRDVSGKFLELDPRNLFNAKAVYAPVKGIGGFFAVRYEGKRFLNRRNTFETDSFTEWDAGVSYGFSGFHVQLTGRNLGDSRHFGTESEIGDSQFYVAAPRRFTVDGSYSF
jgi:outer membrane receptor protein involved in Fe transport